MDDKLKQFSELIAYVVLNDRKNVIDLILHNNIPIDKDHIDNEKLVSVLYQNLTDNSNFRINFENYIKQALGQDGYSNGDGFWGDVKFGDATNILKSGLDLFGQSQAGKDARSIAEANSNATIHASDNALEMARLNLQAAQSNLTKSSAPAKNNTLLYVGLGIGAVVILGLTIFAVTRKK